MAEVIDGEGAEAAERYAQAAFELGLAANTLPALDADLAAIAAAFKESADLREAASSPLIDPQDKARALIAIADRLGLSPLGRNLVGAAAQNRRAAELPMMARAFSRLYARHRGAQRAEIISAAPLTPAQLKDIEAALSAAMGATIEAETFVDESLVGGFIARVGSRQFDASLKTKLASLRAALKAS